MRINIKKLHEDAIIPTYSKVGDAGLDLTAISRDLMTNDNTTADYIEYGTGLAIEIPQGYVGLIFPRSSLSKKDLILANHVGIIDSNYRGEIKFRYKVDATYDIITLNKNLAELIVKDIDNEILDIFNSHIYEIGDRVGQLIIIPYPQIEFTEVEELSETNRGTGGFGSTGK
jgi:dUTP pyrophosphatase